MSTTLADSIMETVRSLDLDLVVLIKSFYLLVAAGVFFPLPPRRTPLPIL
jgi:hypothetical protein